MPKSILARPNLKLFLLAAILIAVAQDFFVHGRSQASLFKAPPMRVVRLLSDEELNRLLEQTRLSPNAGAYLEISHNFEKRRNIRKAIYYLRKAEACMDMDERL